MRDDRHAGALEDAVQLVDRLLFCRSIHSKLSFMGSRKARRAGVDPAVSRCAKEMVLNAGRRLVENACPPARLSATGSEG
jgi:hypothetical protein